MTSGDRNKRKARRPAQARPERTGDKNAGKVHSIARRSVAVLSALGVLTQVRE